MKNVSLDKSPLSQLGNSKAFPVSALECLCDKISILLENCPLLKQHGDGAHTFFLLSKGLRLLFR